VDVGSEAITLVPMEDNHQGLPDGCRVRGHRPSVHGGHITSRGLLVDVGSEAYRPSAHGGPIVHMGLLVDVVSGAHRLSAHRVHIAPGAS